MATDSRRNKRKRAYPKGRQLDEAALAEVRERLGLRSRARDLLIEHLHLLQDHFGCLEARHLFALAEEMKIGQAEIYEVASFYEHFDIVKEGEEKPPKLTIRICESLPCVMAGARELRHMLAAKVDPCAIRVLAAPCMGRCDMAPAARIGQREVGRASVEGLFAMAECGETRTVVPAALSLKAYSQGGGYQLLYRLRHGELSIDHVLKTLSQAGLRGLGGAGFPLGKKWEIVRSYPRPRLMTINGDEGEPGTFKDRVFLETDPHRLLEGALIAAQAVEAERIYFYMRDEYQGILEVLRREITLLEEQGVVDPGFIVLRRGAGAYICGEESAMIESIEGKRGLPRHRPPYIAEKGLFGCPTLNHNVETLCWIRDILEKGADWFINAGRDGHPGLRSWSVSGRVRHAGVKRAPAGITVRELIDDYCGGMSAGHRFKAYLPGGASGGILPASMGDIPLDFGGRLAKLGAFVGSHAVIILSDKDNIRDVTLNLMEFFKHESCGQCTPCRGGTEKMVTLLKSQSLLDEQALRDLEEVMRDSSICGLGQAAPNPVNHLLTYFGDDL